MGMSDEAQEKREEALYIACQSGVIAECEIHSGIYFAGPEEDESEAYKLAAIKFKAGELGCTYKNQRELTDIVQSVILDNSCVDECPCCARAFGPD